MAKIINQDGRKYYFTPGKKGKLISPSRNVGKPGLLGTYEPNPVKSKSVPTPLVPQKQNPVNPAAIRGMSPMKKKNMGIVRALGSRSIY